MARTASGSAHVEAARQLLKAARTAGDLRLAQAVLLPLDLGLSLAQTARAIGRSRGATCTMRTRFCKMAEGQIAPPRSKRALRNRAKADLAQEAQILDAVMAGPAAGEGRIAGIQRAIAAQLGKPLALSSVYRMLARHGWRRLPPQRRADRGATAAGDAQSPPARGRWSKTRP